jgi:hypothetical protein
MLYALQVFGAIYDYEIADTPERADLVCEYGPAQRAIALPGAARRLTIPALYRPRRHNEGIPKLSVHQYASETLALVHGIDPESGNPDWLGEIFEWISSSLELPISARDAVGRVPYAETAFVKQGLSAGRAHCSAIMAWLEKALRGENAGNAWPQASSPLVGTKHFVVSSHDIDFHFTARPPAIRRFVKNLGVAATHYRSGSFFATSTRMLIRTLRNERPGDYIRPMLNAIEERGFRSTLFAVADGTHRRDPEYSLRDIAPHLTDAQGRGFPVAVHGSYGSVIENDSLSREKEALRRVAERRPLGGRQHWLRFGNHARFFRSVEGAGFAYDSTLGFAETCGFRNGASFAFPPYDFEAERPHAFLEIPLVVMDGSLALAAREIGVTPLDLAEQILAESRKWGWGGVSVLWHNPMEPVQVPDEINQVFWSCAAKRKEFSEEWVSAEEFLKLALPRFQAAGLLTELNLDA